MKKLFYILVLLVPLFSLAQKGTIKGYISSSTNGEPVIFANIILDNGKTGSSSDVNGYFIFNNIPQGNHQLKIQCIGFLDTIANIEVTEGKTTNIKIELIAKAKQLDVVEINAKNLEKELARNNSLVSVEKITSQDITKMPSIGGQADIAQYIQVLPGVVFSGDQGGQLYIRGGSAIQNKVLLDGMTVYNPFHSIGLFSVFETDIIRSADIYTGGFSAQYGGRISSIMDITTKEGNKKHVSGKISASTFGASALIEGPIIKDNGKNDISLSYIFTAKNSYLSHTSKNIYDYLDNNLPYDFLDIYGKITLSSSLGTKVNLFGFNFTDKVDSYQNLADFSWRNTGVGANFIIVPPSSPSIVKATIAYSDYKMEMNEISNGGYQQSKISSFNGNLNTTTFFTKNQLSYGVDVIANTTNTLYQTNSESIKEYSTEIGGYTIFKGFWGSLLYEPSLRFSYYASLDEFVLEPRLSVKYNLTSFLRLKAALGHYSQSIIDTKSDRDIVNLFTGYLTPSADLEGGVVSSYRGNNVDSYIAKANHYIFGIEYDILKRLTLNCELYYKTMSNLIGINRDRLYNNDADHLQYNDYLTKNFAVEEGKAYGGDISLKYSDGRLYMWAIYSYGKVEKKNENTTYNPHYDRRHNINILVSYQMGQNRSWEISARWNYGSGFPYTATAGFAQGLSFSDINTDFTTQAGDLHTLYSKLNGERLPSYHRLDISVKKRFDLPHHCILEIEGSVSNVYDRNNLFYYDRITSCRVDQLPILPSLGLTLKF